MKTGKQNENIFYYVFGGIFTACGLIMLVIGICFAMSNAHFVKGAENVKGTITDIVSYRDHDGDLEHEVYVEYEYEGNRYETRLNEYSSSMNIGKSIDLYVDPKDPYSAKGKGSIYILPIVFSVIGGVFTCVGLPFILIGMRKQRHRKAMLENGECLYAIVVGSGINHAYRMNHRNPYWIDCQYQDPATGEQYLFRSGHVWEDPACYMGQQVPVYVNRNDRSQYYVAVDMMQRIHSNNHAIIHDYRK